MDRGVERVNNRPMDAPSVEFVIVDQDDLDVEVQLGGLRIGRANCDRDGDRLWLADISIDDEFRHQGIGSQLLQFLLRHADAAGVREVWGSVTHDDLTNWPGLINWYERHGFVSEPPDSECLAGAALKIVRRRTMSHRRVVR